MLFFLYSVIIMLTTMHLVILLSIWLYRQEECDSG
jgi:hypothetical protein